MQFVNYFLSSVVSYSGVIAGIFLIRKTEEEQNPLQKYFILSKIIISILISLFLLSYFFYIKNYALFFVSLILPVLLFSKIKALNYPILGVFFYFSSVNQNLFAINTALIFIYGLVYAALNYDISKKNTLYIIKTTFYFLLMSNIAFLFDAPL